MGENALLLARALKLLAEIALLAGLGQALLGWLLGIRRERNVVYGLFKVIAAPTRWMAMRIVRSSPRGQRVVGLLALLCLWCAALAWKVSLCLPLGVTLCR